VGPGANNVVIQGNLFASNDFRNPVITAGSMGYIVNNLIYNPGFAAIHTYGRDGKLAESTLQVSMIGNVIKAGPNTRNRVGLFHTAGLNAGSRLFLKDNVAMGTDAFDEKSLPKGWAAGTTPFVNDPPVPLPDYVKPIPSDKVVDRVLANAGARVNDRDAVDARIIQEVKTGAGAIKDAPTDPRLTANPPAKDTTAGPANAANSSSLPHAGTPVEKGKNSTQEIAPGVSLDLVWVEALGCWVGKYEITQQQYDALVGTNPSVYRGPTLPADNISWNQATAYCKLLAERLHKTGAISFGEITLPTEKQWSTFVGDAKLDDAVFKRWEGKPLGTMPVGSKGPNQYGLYDVRGNVNEWCKDKVGNSAVLRGGGWANTGDGTMDIGHRMPLEVRDSNFNTGFRVLLIP
jgi:formylglycine-generating enzyme required for sulfatase activity